MLDPSHFLELKASGNLPSPKGAALKVMELCQRESATLPQIIRVLQTDPATVGRILKLANSAAFRRVRPAVSLTTDVLISIGLHTVRQVVLAFSLVTENKTGKCPGFDYEAFWSRSAATGAATQLIAAATRLAPPADLFTVGLLSNVGRLALAALHSDRYGALLAQVSEQCSPALTALEKEAFGYTHLDLAVALMSDWGVPRLYSEAVLFHEAPELADFDEGSRSSRTVQCVQLGARLVGHCLLPQDQRGPDLASLLLLAREIGIADADLARLGNQMLREWRDWSVVLGIAVRDVAPFSTIDAAA